ncbi:DUF5701 family protein [Brachybacterium sp. GCM10030252]|uniref:DUF5701 family protein n=1 Tax=Brachybacterium sp. GCM10030252 TaxID=3273380 RepID=UPI0036186328
MPSSRRAPHHPGTAAPARGDAITQPDAALPTNAAPTAVSLPSLADQAQRLIDLDVHARAGLTAQALHAAADSRGSARTDALLAIRPDLAPPSALAPLMRRADKPGFVVEDMTDVDEFAPVGIDVPSTPVYVVEGVDRGDAFANRTPEESLPEITGPGRSPLLLMEGLHWVLQQPGVLERNHCFMTIGSRLTTKSGKFDSRTPALWISNGTGRDGRERKDAPKLGWCWWGNRHTWLGIASAAGRVAVS